MTRSVILRERRENEYENEIRIDGGVIGDRQPGDGAGKAGIAVRVHPAFGSFGGSIRRISDSGRACRRAGRRAGTGQLLRILDESQTSQLAVECWRRRLPARAEQGVRAAAPA